MKEISFFGEFLYALRMGHKPRKLSQDQLAQALGTTRQYIDAIEKRKAGTAPPNFRQCLKLADELGLGEQNRNEFLRLAFVERIRNNLEFYDHFHKQGASPVVQTEKTYSGCSYAISWNTKHQKPLLNEAVVEFVRKSIADLLSDSGYVLEEISVSNAHVGIVLTVDIDFYPKEFIEGLKDAIARKTKNQFPEIALESSSIWDKNWELYTLGQLPPQWPVNAPVEVKSYRGASKIWRR